MAIHPLIFGNMGVGFYSAYFMDVTPVVWKTEDQKFPYLQYTATHENRLINGENTIIFKFDLSAVSVVFNHK